MKESPVAEATGAFPVNPAAPPNAANPEHDAFTERESARDSTRALAEAGSGDPAGSLGQLDPRGSVGGGDGAQPAILHALVTGAKKHWFIVGVVLVVLLAAAYPDLGKKRGILRTEISVNYVAVAIIFVLSGLGLQTRVLANALLFWKMHLIIQGLSLGLFPLVIFGCGKLLILVGFNEALAQGVIIACSTPTTVASNVLMTKSGYGNEPAALMNAVLGNIIGVFISPALIGAYTTGIAQGSSSVSYSDVFVNLGLTVIAPLVLGQLVQYFAPRFVAWLKRHVSFPDLSSALLLLLVYSVFCNTFAENVTATTPAADLIAVVFIDLAILVVFAAFSFTISRTPIFGFTRSDTVAVVNCAATKTLALGIPIITAMFANSPLVGLYSIPLIVYHAEQIILGAFLVSAFQRWVRKGPPTPYFPDQIDEEAIAESPTRRMS